MAHENINDLREQVRKARARATRKAARFRRQGVQIADTRFDPRRTVGIEKKYSTKQLERYLADLEAFTDRRTQFVPGARGVPIRRESANRLITATERFNKTREYMGRRFEGQRIKGTSRTYGEVNNLGKERGYMMERGPLARQLDGQRRLVGVVSDEAANRLARGLEKRASPAGQKREVRKARFNLLNMAGYAGDGGTLWAEINNMTDDQVMAFWSSDVAVNALQITLDSDSGMYGVNEDPSGVQDAQYSNTWEQLQHIKSSVK